MNCFSTDETPAYASSRLLTSTSYSKGDRIAVTWNPESNSLYVDMGDYEVAAIKRFAFREQGTMSTDHFHQRFAAKRQQFLDENGVVSRRLEKMQNRGSISTLTSPLLQTNDRFRREEAGTTAGKP